MKVTQVRVVNLPNVELAEHRGFMASSLNLTNQNIKTSLDNGRIFLLSKLVFYEHYIFLLSHRKFGSFCEADKGNRGFLQRLVVLVRGDDFHFDKTLVGFRTRRGDFGNRTNGG